MIHSSTAKTLLKVFLSGSLMVFIVGISMWGFIHLIVPPSASLTEKKLGFCIPVTFLLITSLVAFFQTLRLDKIKAKGISRPESIIE